MAKGPTEGQSRGVNLRDENGDGYGVKHTDNVPHVLISTLDNAVDGVTTAIKTIDYAHHEAHAGSFFEYVNAIDLGGAATISYVVVTPDTTKYAHFGLSVDAELEFDLTVYEGATGITNGSLATNPAVINANRNVSDVHTTLIYTGPTLGGGSKGTLIRHWHGGSGKNIGGRAGTTAELILKRNTKYWFDLTNVVTPGSNYISVYAGWYEHTHP